MIGQPVSDGAITASVCVRSPLVATERRNSGCGRQKIIFRKLRELAFDNSMAMCIARSMYRKLEAVSREGWSYNYIWRTSTGHKWWLYMTYEHWREDELALRTNETELWCDIIAIHFDEVGHAQEFHASILILRFVLTWISLTIWTTQPMRFLRTPSRPTNFQTDEATRSRCKAFTPQHDLYKSMALDGQCMNLT